jgi:hypothetical protein
MRGEFLVGGWSCVSRCGSLFLRAENKFMFITETGDLDANLGN